MKINELIEQKKHCVGTCVNSFDEDGNCIVTELPWDDASAFAVADEESKEISKEEFFKEVELSPELLKRLSKHRVKFFVADGVYMIYDENTDIHYFFN